MVNELFFLPCENRFKLNMHNLYIKTKCLYKYGSRHATNCIFLTR